MSQKKYLTKQIMFFATLTPVLVTAVGILKPLILPKITSAIPLNQSPFLMALKFNLPPKGAPGKRRGASTRDYCSSKELIALMPGTNFGLTIAERPTFWFYVPYPETLGLEAEFSLTDKEGNEVYQQIVTLKNTPGIVKFTFPATESPLELEKFYTWRFSVICDPNNRLDDAFVNGAVERVPITSQLESKLQDNNYRKRIDIYAENGLWFDLLTTLAELCVANLPDTSIDEDWENLLQQVQLEKIADKPFVDCCNSEE
ncbi:MAG: DUF928 domain-containing protein [Okeania sp. SIO3I5]|uniref:DUF928 domain-containing protein n=1 Tax=Okeania sp. SIO3I5 TaxID=2607805 RepID=UPI0013BD6603|nr:DUF928 domain-containing protein [Okeania sp. SIO3I5]NEQ40654.1 DUF928 domain-containing protein [Okeania sp. SIO3I5]